MTKTRKITAWVMMVAIMLPAFAIFNDNAEAFMWNVLGLVYVAAAIAYAPKILPRWVVEYFKSL